MSGKIKRVLIYRLGSLGDTVVALPAFHRIASSFPDSERRLLTNHPVSAKAPAAAAVIGESGLVHGYFRYQVGVRNLAALLRLWWELVRWRPQVLVYLGAARGVKSARRDAFFFFVCGIRRQLGVPLSPMMQNNLVQGSAGELEPECERLMRNLGARPIDDSASWDLRLTRAERAKAQEVLTARDGRPILAVSVGTKVQSKDWGADNWCSLLHAVGGLYPHYALALLGAAEEMEASERAAAGWRAGAGTRSVVLPLYGRLTARESAACLAESRLFLGHDSGPMHLAAAVQTPCVAIFAARNIPRVWFPYGAQHRVVYHAVECSGCGLEECVIERKRCITSITVDEVLAEVRSLLEVAGGRTGVAV